MKSDWSLRPIHRMLDTINSIGKPFPPKEVIKHLEEMKND